MDFIEPVKGAVKLIKFLVLESGSMKTELESRDFQIVKQHISQIEKNIQY